MDAERLAEIAHVCPSGAIRYRRKDGQPDEAPPPVNLIAVREGGPYAVRADIRLDGKRGSLPRDAVPLRRFEEQAVLRRLAPRRRIRGQRRARDRRGRDRSRCATARSRSIPQLDGPLQVRGNLEITSGTGRRVARVTQARLCRCGGSATKPFCDGTHARIGFRST